ncbi:MAG TPA: hypothetical protein VK348_05635, partial [Planctomycetota bacterium]|nr:hypothetical protein [Planctomycetota bacterium]
LRGRLLDLLEIDLAYSTALEAALGENVQALVVDTRSHAEAIAQQLQSERSGRVLLLVEQEFGPELAQAPSLLPLPEGARFLLDLVKPVGSSPASQRLLGWLLRGVALVPSLAHAASNRPDLCFVTPDGSLLCGPRLEGGASAEGHTGLVVRRSQILKLGEQKLEVQQRLERLQVGKDAAASRVETLKLELRQIGSALAAARRRGQEIEGQLARLSARDADLLRERSDLDGEAQELRRQRFLATALLGRCLLDAHLLARAEAVLQAQEQTFSTDIATAQAAAEAAARAEQELRLQQVQAGEAREGQLRSSRMHEEALQELERALQELASTAQSAAAGAERAAAEQARLLELGEQVARELAGFEAQRQDCVRTLDGARAERSARQQTLEQWDQQRSSLHDQASAARLELAEHEHRFARLEERLREDCEVELRRCLLEVHGIGLEDPAQFPGPVPPPDVVETLAGPPLPPAVVDTWYSMQRLWQLPQFQPADARKEAQVLQAQKERLGAVNLDAVRELDEEEGQFTTLEQEVGDLKSARTSLLETLRKLETESKLLFEQTFTEARKNFQEIFRKLFQGGKADMYLSQLQDGDSLEAGIEIVAQPPGKQLQSINLLSGGERSLTAVAILFALFKVRPSPFCILDEVDAALDETNVERFLRVLRDFITDTQFCIVTHHKRTMAECQVLYGITMQRRGVSSRIAVALHEVDGFKQGSGNGNRLDPAAKKRIAGEEAVGF